MGEMADLALEQWTNEWEDERAGLERFESLTARSRVHITKDRQEIPIIEMEDTHLLNTALLILRRAHAKRKQVDSQGARLSRSKFQAKLRGTREVNEEELADEINNNVVLAGLYITEIVRRKLDLAQVSNLLQQIYAE